MLLAFALVNSGESKMPPVDVGDFCGGRSTAYCRATQVCEPSIFALEPYSGICVHLPGDVGEDCGGGFINSRICKPGLQCKVDGEPMPGKKGTCAEK